MDYVILVLPNHNRVYREQAPSLAIEELAALNQYVFTGQLSDIRQEQVGGLDCIAFSGPELEPWQLEYVRTLSFCFGCFQREGELLRPIDLPGEDYFPDDLLTILKYSGKTNEAFTALLYNVTLWAGAFGDRFFERLRILDPVCGRGTTLYYALTRGHDADGLELAKADVQVIDQFLSRYLQEHRYKHQIQRGRVTRPQGGTGRRITAQGAKSKEELKANPFSLNVINDDTVNVNNHFARGTYHALVADLPYGVQHGGSGTGRGHISAGALLSRALPVWTKVLKKGGTVGVSWNVNATPRSAIVTELEAAGLELVPGLEGFEHRVDQAVRRDLAVARKR
ncbi:MAG: SAM-dependent methyltransferase [Firmicutes bacterium]|nr:SAM-dependent methyltransferase [Bacillota bacterium]